MPRYAIVRPSAGSDENTIARYLPGNYEVIGTRFRDIMGEYRGVLIAGEDEAGWTMDGYVLPRLGSGLHTGREVRGTKIKIGYSECAVHCRVAGKTLHVIEEDTFCNGNTIPEEARLGCWVIDEKGVRVPMLKSEAGWRE